MRLPGESLLGFEAMRISVVIPVFEDRGEVLRLVPRLEEADETIVVDASVADPVRTTDLPPAIRLIRAGWPNRAHQQNLGAEAASGETLLFLHADTRLSEEAFDEIRGALADREVVGGGFERQFDSSSRLLRWSCRVAGWRGRWLGWFLGDQAIFVRRGVFRRLGGFRMLTVFEDYDLCRRLKESGRMCCLRPPVRSSDRRFARDGPGWRSCKDLALTGLYLAAGSQLFDATELQSGR